MRFDGLAAEATCPVCRRSAAVEFGRDRDVVVKTEPYALQERSRCRCRRRGRHCECPGDARAAAREVSPELSLDASLSAWRVASVAYDSGRERSVGVAEVALGGSGKRTASSDSSEHIGAVGVPLSMSTARRRTSVEYPIALR